MPDRRGREHHFERLADALREEIGAILEGELADPRIGLASVSEVQLSPEGRSARVIVIVPGDDQQAEESMKGLMSARNFIRREVGERLHLRHAPELFFQLDRSEEYQSRIEKLLARTRKRKRSSG
ncbi:MAG TPA: 30S ribosome-binding factor RbfA [Terriglobales bacterium]|jgi:ribosome-binding factor A|nr:30S ribosome-binding factor RbfA [Terriglobales bacterium]